VIISTITAHPGIVLRPSFVPGKVGVIKKDENKKLHSLKK